MQFDEAAFQQWYRRWANIAGIDPNPDNPLHRYDYRAAYRAGVQPQIHPADGRYHWPSVFKAPDHPNRFVGGMDTLMETPILPKQDPKLLRQALTDMLKKSKL